MVVDEGVIHRFIRQTAVRTDGELHDECEAVLALIQGREIGRKPLGEHREDSDAGVDGGSVRRGVLICCGAGRHERRHVRDAQPHEALHAVEDAHKVDAEHP
mgnify:CR=1 FL=1